MTVEIRSYAADFQNVEVYQVDNFWKARLHTSTEAMQKPQSNSIYTNYVLKYVQYPDNKQVYAHYAHNGWLTRRNIVRHAAPNYLGTEPAPPSPFKEPTRNIVFNGRG